MQPLLSVMHGPEEGLKLGVGAALAAQGKRTLCLDCDAGLRNLDLALGITDRVVMDFTDVIAGRTTLDTAIV